MSHDKHDKKHKKLHQILKNRHNQVMFDQAARARDLDEEREEEKKSAALAASAKGKQGTAGEPVWSAKMQQIRDRNTGRMRDSKERWNRFAGTESGGGRGL